MTASSATRCAIGPGAFAMTALEERPRETALHLPAAVGHEPEARRERREGLVEARAVPGGHEGVGPCQ